MDCSIESTMDFTQDDTIDIFTDSKSDMRNFNQKSITKSYRSKSRVETVPLDSASKLVENKTKKAKIDISKEEMNVIDFPSETSLNLDFIQPLSSNFSEININKSKDLKSLNHFSLVIHRLPIEKYKNPIIAQIKRKATKIKGKAVKKILTKPITEDIANYVRNRTRSETKGQTIIVEEEETPLSQKRRKSAPVHKDPTPVITVPDSTVIEPCVVIQDKVEIKFDKQPLVQETPPQSMEIETPPATVVIEKKHETNVKSSISFYAEEDIINIQISPLYLSENQSFLENCESESPLRRDTPNKHKKEPKPSPTGKFSPSTSSKKSQPKRSPSRSSKRSPKRSPSRKDSSRWESPVRTRSPRRSPIRKSSPKRSPARKISPKLSPARKSPPRRSPVKKSSPKRSPSRKCSPIRSPTRKSPLRRSPLRKSPRRSPLRRSSPRRSPPRRSPPRRSSPRRNSPRRLSPRRNSPRRVSPRRSPARKWSPRRSPYRKSPTSESLRRSPLRRSPYNRRSPFRGRSYSPTRRTDRRSPVRRSPIRRSSPRRSSPRRNSRSPYRSSPPRRSPTRRSSPRGPSIPSRNNAPHNPLHNYRIPKRSPVRHQDTDPVRTTARRSPITYSRFSDRSKSPNWDQAPVRTTPEYEHQPRNVQPPKPPERIIQHTTLPIKKIIRMESPVSMSISPETSTQEDDGDTWRIVSRSSARSRVNLVPNRPRSRSSSPARRSFHVADEFFDSDSGSPFRQHDSLHREVDRSYSPKLGVHPDSNRLQFVSYNYNPYLDDPTHGKGKSTIPPDDNSILENMFSSPGESQTQPQPEPEIRVEPEPQIYLPTEHYLPKDIPLPLHSDSEKDPIHLPFSERSVKCPLCKSVLFAKRYELHIREKCMQRHKLNPEKKDIKQDQNRDKSLPTASSSSTSGSADPYVLKQVPSIELRPFKCPEKNCEYIDRIVNIRQHYYENHMFMVCFNCNLRIIDPNTFPHHLSQCYNRVPAMCHLCSNHYPLNNSFSLGLHIVKDHNTETCSICQQGVSLKNFPLHMKRCMFNSQHRFRCPTCSASIRIDAIAQHFLTQHFRDVCAICKRFTTPKKLVHVSRCFLNAAFLNIKNVQPETMVKCTLCSIQTTFYDIASHILKEHPHAMCSFCEGIFSVKEFATHVAICCQRQDGIPIARSQQTKRTPVASYQPPIVAQTPPVMYPTFNYPSNPHMVHNRGFVSPTLVHHQTPPNIFRTPQPRIFPSNQYGIRKSYTN